MFKKIMIEPTNLCNLRCPICTTGMSYNSSERGSMTYEQFKEVVTPIKGRLREVNLYNLGEPFLALDIFKMIKYVGDNNISLTIHTNGLCLDSKKINYFKNHKSPLCLVFSIDGINQMSYEYYRVGGNLEIALANLKKIVKIKNKYNLQNLRIVWQFLVNKKNEDEVEIAEDMAKNIGVDVIRFKTININKKDPRYNDYIPSKEEYCRVEKNKKFVNNKCDFLDSGIPVVAWNGDVQVCCTKPSKNKIMGNVFKESLLDIWNNNSYLKFRNDFKNKKNKFCNEYCASKRKCIVYSKVITF